MKKILSLLLLYVLCSCSTFEKTPQRIEYACVLGKSQFFAEIPNIISAEGFEIYNVDELRNHIIAVSDTFIDRNQVRLNLTISYDTSSRHYFVTPSARFTKDSISKVEYYSEDKMNKHFKTKFQTVLNRLESYCKGNFFPNRP